MSSPRVAITMGDPAGVGPEVVLKALSETSGEGNFRPVVIGDLEWLRRVNDASALNLPIVPYDPSGGTTDRVEVIDLGDVPAELSVGEPSRESGFAAYEAIRVGVEQCVQDGFELLITAPISKVALNLAGLGHQGHTEILQELTASDWALTVFTLPDLKVLYLTRHLSLRNAIDAVTADLIRDTLERFVSEAGRIAMSDPRIAVAALNPHAGEGGLFGTEEIEHIVPGIEAAQRLGIDVTGPVPADSVFHQARQGRYDIVLCLYHDQAALVTKSIDFDATVSVTLGLPFLRFSVDHGTAYDIAGMNRADPANMVNVLSTAVEILDRNPSDR